MSLLDKFLNPLGYEFSRLDNRDQRVIASIVLLYSGCHDHIVNDMLKPLQEIISVNKSEQLAGMELPNLTDSMKEELAEEAFVAILKCCSLPSKDRLEHWWRFDPETWREILGSFVLAGILRNKGDSSIVLIRDTSYSTDLDEARTQLLVRWMNILDISSSNFISILSKRGFSKVWESYVKSMLNGILLGFQRIPETKMVDRAKGELSTLSTGRKILIRELINTLSRNEMPERALDGQSQSDRAVLFNGSGMPAGEVTFAADGKATITAWKDADADFVAFWMATYIISSNDLSEAERKTFSKWAGLPEQVWSNLHRQMFGIAMLHWLQQCYQRGEGLHVNIDEIEKALADPEQDLTLTVSKKEGKALAADMGKSLADKKLVPLTKALTAEIEEILGDQFVIE